MAPDPAPATGARIPPPAARRLFPDQPPADLDLTSAAPFVVERLLEDGDGADLAWLFAALSEARVSAWLAERGDRRLSRRSRAFWSLVLGADFPASPGSVGSPAGGRLRPHPPFTPFQAPVLGTKRSQDSPAAGDAPADRADLWPL